MTALEEDARDQYERTHLAWRRTALSLVAAGLLVAHLAARDIGSGALVATLSATTAVVAFVWLSSHGRQSVRPASPWCWACCCSVR